MQRQSGSSKKAYVFIAVQVIYALYHIYVVRNIKLLHINQSLCLFLFLLCLPIHKNYSENQTRAKVAKYVSLHGKKISHPTLATAEKVYDVAQKEPATFGQIWEDLNSEKISPHKAFKKVQKMQIRQKFLAETPAMLLPGGLKLIEGDFVEKNLDIADKSVDLILTDPPYNLKSLPLIEELAKVASRVLKDGGSLVTYCGQDYKYQIQQFMESSGLTPRWELAVILSGPYARIFKKQVLVTWKPSDYQLSDPHL